MSAEALDLRYERLYLRALDGELNHWGRWIERHSDYEGYPGVNAVEAYANGRGDGVPGHKILCLDMPADVYATHGRILACTEEQQEAIWLYYAIRVKEDGTLWSLIERCLKIGINQHAMWKRLRRAKMRILGLE